MHIQKVIDNLPETKTPNTLYLLKKTAEPLVHCFLSDNEGTGVYELSKKDHSVRLDGELVFYIGAPKVFVITNYDFETSYDIRVERGTIKREDDTLIYTPPLTSGFDTLEINGKVYTIEILDNAILQPEIIFPSSGAINISRRLLVTTDAFTVANGEDLSPESAEFQLSLSPDFLETIPLAPWFGDKNEIVLSDLTQQTTYYVRVRYQGGGNLGYSPWSNTVMFTTAVFFLPLGETGTFFTFGQGVLSADGQKLAVLDAYNTFNIFKNTGGNWNYEAGLSDSSSNITYEAMQAISMDYAGNRIATRGALENNPGGSVLVWSKTDYGWGVEQILTSIEPYANNQFGVSLALSDNGDVLVVTEPNKELNGLVFAGCAQVFQRTGTVWNYTATLSAEVPVVYSSFGGVVDISGDGKTIVVGSHWEPVGDGKTGAVYIYKEVDGVWSQEKRISVLDTTSTMMFGQIVRLSKDGSTLLVGQPSYRGTNFVSYGAAYVFKRIGGVWAQEAFIENPDKNFGHGFGEVISMSEDGEFFVTGALYSANYSPDTYKQPVFFYKKTQGVWSQLAGFTPVDPTSKTDFRQMVALSADGQSFLLSIEYTSGGVVYGVSHVYTS